MSKLTKAFDIALGAVISAIDARDVLLWVGLGLVGYGLSLIFWPAAFIVPGVVLVAIAVFGTR